MRLIWATRGRAWGFRFLSDGGFTDPLPAFEAAFDGMGSEPSALKRQADKVAARFPDPLGRVDAAGRLIPHEMVLFAPTPSLESVEDVIEQIWPMVADRYAVLWDSSAP